LEVTIQLNSTDKQLELFGPADSYLRILRQSLDVQLNARQGRLIIKGKEKDVNRATDIVDRMQEHLRKHGLLTPAKVNTLIRTLDSSKTVKTGKAIAVYAHKKVIGPTTKGQQKYIETMLANDLTFCIGPAGTGKTYLAVAIAVSMLKKSRSGESCSHALLSRRARSWASCPAICRQK